MPIKKYTKNKKSGWQYGSGTCFIGKGAKKKAIAQALTIGGGVFPEDHLDAHEGTLRNFREFVKQIISQTKNKTLKIKKSSIWLYPFAIERNYARYIKKIMKQFTSITVEEMKPLLKTWKIENKKLLEDDAIDDLERINKEFKETQNFIFVENELSLRVDLGLTALSVGEFNKKQHMKTMKQALGFVYETFEPWEDPLIKQWVFENVNLIKGLSDDYIKKINQTVMNAFNTGQTAESLARELTKINNEFATGRRALVTKDGKPVLTKSGKPKFRRVQSRADLVARDQIGKLNGQYTKKRQTDVGVDKYIWNTSGDARVRTKHAAMNGKLCMWDDSSVYSVDGGKSWISRSSIGGIELHPGMDVQCRCGAEAFWDDFINEIEQEAA